MLRTPLAALLLAAGCASTAPASGPEPAAADTPPAETAAPDGPAPEVRLGVGETAEHDGHTLTFAGVAEDSRCPEDVECIWAGRATIYVEVDDVSYSLTLPYSGQTPEEVSTVDWGGTTMTVTDLAPYPGTEAARRDEPVTATFTPTAP